MLLVSWAAGWWTDLGACERRKSPFGFIQSLPALGRLSLRKRAYVPLPVTMVETQESFNARLRAMGSGRGANINQIANSHQAANNHAAAAAASRGPLLSSIETLDSFNARLKRLRQRPPDEDTSITRPINQLVEDDVQNVVIIGSGPAGYTAALFNGRANLKPLVFEGMEAGPPGGALLMTTLVENFPGFPDGILGPDLVRNMRMQAQRWGAEMVPEDVVEVDLSQRPFRVRSHSRHVLTQAIIFATGSKFNRLRLPNEVRFWNRGISSCAVCDGVAPVFRDVDLGVAGGGDTACEDALFLSNYGNKIHMFIRGSDFRASRAMVAKVICNPNIEIHFNTKVKDVYGDDVSPDHASPVQGVIVQDTNTGEERKIEIRGLFYALGGRPNTQLLEGSPVRLDQGGHIMLKPGTMETYLEGFFAAGDVSDSQWKQAITAAGGGCRAAISAERWLTSNGLARFVPFKCDIIDGDRSRDEEYVEEPAMESETQATFDISKPRHKGAYALQRLQQETKPVVVLYCTRTCGQCRVLRPALQTVVGDYYPDVHFCEVDIDEDTQFAKEQDVLGTPTVAVYRSGRHVGTLRGVHIKQDYRELIEEAMGRAPATNHVHGGGAFAETRQLTSYA